MIETTGGAAIRIAIRLCAPSVTECGFRLNSLVGDPEARACLAGVEAGQQEVLKRIEERLGHPIKVVWRFTRSANVISAWANPSELETIRSVEGVASVTEETRNEPNGRAIRIPAPPHNKTSI